MINAHYSSLTNSLALTVDPHFVASHSLFQRIAHLWIATSCARFQYYFAWILAEGANNAAGFGGQIKKSKDKVQEVTFDLLCNVKVLKVEFALNLKGVLDNWNIQTSLWLRYICYERTKENVTKTMMLSALWHGLYPGYFLTFASASLITEAARKARSVIRPLFQQQITNTDGKVTEVTGGALSKLYDFLTFLVTANALNLMTGPFLMMHFNMGIEFWKNFYWVLHIGSILLYLLPAKKKDKVLPAGVAANANDKKGL